MNTFYKKISIIFLTVLSFQLSATHNRSGEILYKRVAPFGTVMAPVFTYSITIITYTDDGPGISDRCEDTVFFGDGQKGVASRINGTVGCGGCNNCGVLIVNQLNYRVKLNIYTINHTYASPGIYLVSVTDPNRTAGTHNIPISDQVPFSIQSVIDANSAIAFNSSPAFSNPPVYMAYNRSCFELNRCAFDADGDSLSYELVACNSAPNQSVTGYFDPETGTNGTFSINPVTGLITWCSPQFEDLYNIAMRVYEWRKISCNTPYQFIGYVTTDMQIIVIQSQTVTLTALAGPDDCVVAGSPYSRVINANVTSGSFSVTLYGSSNSSGNLPLATLTQTSGTTNLSTIFNWQTNCSHVQRNAHQINLLYQASAQTFYQQFNLKVVPPAPVITSVTIDTGKVTLFWNPITSCTNIIGYNIYRKTGSNSWSPATCETGAPASSGFLYLGTASATATSYVDNNFYSFPSGSIGNYFITTLMENCAESYASNIKTFNITVGLHENNLKDDLKIYPNPFTDRLELELPGIYSGNREIMIFSVDGKLVFKSSTNKANSKTILQLNELERGIYFLQLQTSEGLVSKKIIKD